MTAFGLAILSPCALIIWLGASILATRRRQSRRRAELHRTFTKKTGEP